MYNIYFRLHFFNVTYGTWVIEHKQASESSLCAEVNHQLSLDIYTHAGWVKSTYKDSSRPLKSVDSVNN